MHSALVYALCRSVFLLLQLVPRRVASGTVDFLAFLVYLVDRKHRRIADINLRIAFPDSSPRKRAQLTRASFRWTGRNLLEISRLPLLTRQNVSSLVQYDPAMGIENLVDAQKSGKPLLFLTGHFSAWELLPFAHALYGYPLSFVTRPLDNTYLERFLCRTRERSGNSVISKKDSARAILKELKRGRAVGILMDQNTSPAEGIWTDFFGVPAATSTGLAILALRTNAVVVPGYLSPMRDGRYRITFRPAVDLVRSGDKARDVATNTRRFNQIFEEIIKECPESWLWGHMRWRNQPPGGPENLYRFTDEELEDFLVRIGRRPA